VLSVQVAVRKLLNDLRLVIIEQEGGHLELMGKRGQNEGSIFQRGDGRWCAQLNLGWENGKRRRKCVYGATAQEVQDALLKARADMAAGLPVAVGRQSVAQFLDLWLEDSVKPSVRPLTHEQYRQHVKLYLAPLLGHCRLSKLAPQHIRAFIKRKLEDGLSPRTVQLSIVILRKALSQAVKDGLIGRNVAKLVDGPRVERFEGKMFSPDQARAFLDAARGERLEALYTVALSLGLRMSEALGLCWQDIDFERRTLIVNRILERIGRGQGSTLQLVAPKTSRSRRTVNLPDAAVRALKVHKVRQLEERLAAGSRWQDRGLVFPSRMGTPYEPHGLHDDFKRILAKAKLPDIRFHDLRHSAASLMLAQGIPLRSIQDILGHSSITLTANLYAHVGEKLRREAADAMDTVLAGR
jgi:integrase